MDRQILWDCHMHSSFSADSDTPMEVMIHHAVETGLQGITFTEHLDPDYPVTPDNLDFSLNIPAYKEKLAELYLRQNSHRLNCSPPVRSVKYPPENTSAANIGAPHNMEFASSTSEKMTFIAASRTQRLTSLLRCYSWRHIFIRFLLPNFILFCALCCFSVIKNIPIIKKM